MVTSPCDCNSGSSLAHELCRPQGSCLSLLGPLSPPVSWPGTEHSSHQGWCPHPQNHYHHTAGTSAFRVKPENTVPRRQPSCLPRDCDYEHGLVYRKCQARGKSWKAVNLERKEFIILVLFFSEFLELSVTKPHLPVPVACVCLTDPDKLIFTEL